MKHQDNKENNIDHRCRKDFELNERFRPPFGCLGKEEQKGGKKEKHTQHTHSTMFRAIADIDLFQLETIHDFLRQSPITIEQIRQLFDDNQGQFPLPVQLEQFVLDRLLQSSKRETFRDESLLDLYTSIFHDLLDWSNYTHKQILCIFTLIQGLLCQIEKDRSGKLNESFIHACSILMGGKERKKPVLFNAQQYPQVIDYIVQTIFQHRHLYETLLEEKPLHIEQIEEHRLIDYHVFEQPIFPYPLTEALPVSIHREIILRIPPTPLIRETTDLDQLSRESLATGNEDIPLDLNTMIEQIHGQYPAIPPEQIRQMFAEVSQEYLTEHHENVQQKLREKELALLAKFK